MSKIYQKKKLRKNILITGLFLALFTSVSFILVYLTSAIKSLEFFNITKITVLADEYLDKDKIIKNSGIKVGNNIFELEVKTIVDLILTDPWIKSVKISKHYPKNVTIEAKIKDICGIAKQSQKLIFVDCSGKLIDKFKPKINKEFIVFESYNDDYIAILKFLQALTSINSSDFFNLQNISEINLAEDNYFILKLQQRKEAIHLTLNNLDEKLKQLNKVLIDLDSRNETASKIDATLSTNKIVVKKN